MATLSISKKAKNIALLSIIGKFIKIITSPIIILIISKTLSSEEMAYYYIFFSLITLQQFAELGISHTLKQYISHAFKFTNGIWTLESRKEVKDYFKLACVWYLLVSLFTLIIVGVIGYIYLSGRTGNDIQWKMPWVCLVLSSSITINFSSFLILLEGTQNQEIICKSNIIAGIVSSLLLCVSLFLGYGLYCVSILNFSSLIVNFIVMRKTIVYTIKKLENSDNTINKTLKKISKLFKKVIVVWFFSYLFWNNFNFISFKVFSADYAGKIMFCITLAYSGYTIADSIIRSQMTIFSNMISDGKYTEAKKIFNNYLIVSISILFVGYITFLIIWMMVPNFYLFLKLPSLYVCVQIFLYYIILLYKTNRNDFVRCFKIEPFTKIAIFEGTIIPLCFLFTTMYIPYYSFLMCSILISITCYISILIERNIINEKTYLLYNTRYE